LDDSAEAALRASEAEMYQPYEEESPEQQSQE
jgi:hypothetical protein